MNDPLLADEHVPTAVWSGQFRLFGVDVKCHVLDDGRQIIEDDSMLALLKAMAEGHLDPGDLEIFKKWQRGQT